MVFHRVRSLLFSQVRSREEMHLLPLTASHWLDPAEITAVLIDLHSYKAFYSTSPEIEISARFATIQSLQRIRLVSQGTLPLNREQTFVTIGMWDPCFEINQIALEDAIGLISGVISGDSFAGLGHFNRQTTMSYCYISGYLYHERCTLDYGRLFVDSPAETLVRRKPSGFETLSKIGVWSPVQMGELNSDFITGCWLMGRQEFAESGGSDRAVVRLSNGRMRGVDVMFRCDAGLIRVHELGGPLSLPGIYLGHRAGQRNQDLPRSVISVHRGGRLTRSGVFALSVAK